MLILTRRAGQSIKIGDGITVTIAELSGNQVRVGVSAPRDVPVHREEIYHRIRQDQARTDQVGGLIVTDDDKQLMDEAFWAFIEATNTTTAGGGKQGYQHMLERVAWTLASDHGNSAVAQVFGAIASQFADEGGAAEVAG